MPVRKIVSVVGAAIMVATLGAALPSAARADDPILPLPTPSLPNLLPSPAPSDDEPLLPLPSLPLPGGDAPDQPGNPTGPVNPSDPTAPAAPGGSKGGTSGGTTAQPRPADPDDPAGDRYPHPPFAPIGDNPSAALLQRLYDAQAAQRSLRNQIDTLTASLQRNADAVATAKAELAAARQARDTAAEGMQDEVRAIYKSGAPYAVYTAVSGGSPIRDGARGQLSAVGGASERVSYLSDQLAGAVDSRDATNAKLTELKRQLAKANAIVARFQRAAATDIAGVPSSGLPAGYTGDSLLWPVRGQVTSEYGNRFDPYYRSWQLHAGIDIAAPTGTPVRAAAPGRVVMAGEYGGYGNYVCLAHGTVREQQMTTCYAHLSRIGVRKGQTVGAAQAIGLVGSTGASTGPHLHFEVRLGGRPTDPRLWL
ncbi:MAG: peptidoglycan DD-metalloendopeptidase family protein [Micromonosporaceae bacterium]